MIFSVCRHNWAEVGTEKVNTMWVCVMLVHNIIFIAAYVQRYFPLTFVQRGTNHPTDNQTIDLGLNIPNNTFPYDTPHYRYIEFLVDRNNKSMVLLCTRKY